MQGWNKQDLKQLLQSIVDREINYDGNPVLREFEVRYGKRSPICVQGTSSGAIHYALTYHLQWPNLEVEVLDPHTPAVMVRSIEDCGVPVADLARPLGVHPARLNENTAKELIDLATKDCGDSLQVADLLLDCLESKGFDSGVPGPLNELRDLVEEVS